MKLFLFIILILILSILFNTFNYDYFTYLLKFIWSITTVLIIYSAFKFSNKYKYIQFNTLKILSNIKSFKNKNSMSSFTISLAAKVGVGSLSGVALCLFFGGSGSIFWLMVISLFVSINAYVETKIGMIYRNKTSSGFIGGPSYYIRKCLNNKSLSILYSILLIITYGCLYLSIQSSTIVNTVSYFCSRKIYIVFFLVLLTYIIINNGISRISNITNILVPVMLFLYMLFGIYIIVKYRYNLIGILLSTVRDAFNLRSFLPAFIIALQKSIFITESSIGTSALSSCTSETDPDKQALLEVFGIYIVIFLVCFITFIIISTSNYKYVSWSNISGIDILLYSFNYHFGSFGVVNLSVITILFAFSTIISSYVFTSNNLKILKDNRYINIIFKYIFIFIIIISSYISPVYLWNLADLFLALLSIINTYSLLKITNNKYN